MFWINSNYFHCRIMWQESSWWVNGTHSSLAVFWCSGTIPVLLLHVILINYSWFQWNNLNSCYYCLLGFLIISLCSQYLQPSEAKWNRCQFGKGLKAGNLAFYPFRLTKVNNSTAITKKEYGHNLLYKVLISPVGEQRKPARQDEGLSKLCPEVCQEKKSKEEMKRRVKYPDIRK